MKNLYLYIFLLLIAINDVHSQNPNNHWQLGVCDVNFNTNLPTVTTVANAGQYGNASISDANGNLLFYTDGNTVWSKNHEVMANGGNNNIGSQTSHVVIVPNPANSNQFYIIGARKYNVLSNYHTYGPFYTYSMVEFSNSNPLGIILNINPNPAAGTIETNYSKLLKDAAGNDVSNIYSFDPITVAKNAQENGYWLIVQNKNKILSYSINSSGLSTIPIESVFTDSQLYNYGYEYSNGQVQKISGVMFKMSPDNLKLGALKYNRGNRLITEPANLTSEFYTLNFNSLTGQFSNFRSILGEGGFSVANNFEFSSNSNNVYYVRVHLVTSPVQSGEIMVKDLNNLSIGSRQLTEFSNSTSLSSKFSFLQRDKYGNILVSSIYSDFNRNRYLHKIDNQDSFSGASVMVNAISLNNNPVGYLPQLIPTFIASPCPNNLVITTNVTSGADNKQAANTIVASNTISNGAGAIYHAGSSVTLVPPFHAKSGSTLHAYIAGCTDTFLPKQVQKEGGKAKSLSEIVQDKVEKQSIQITPNPNDGIFSLKSNDITEGFMVIMDIHGVIIYQSAFKNQNSFEMNLQDKPNGIYIVQIQAGGQSYTSKFIKV